MCKGVFVDELQVKIKVINIDIIIIIIHSLLIKALKETVFMKGREKL